MTSDVGRPEGLLYPFSSFSTLLLGTKVTLCISRNLMGATSTTKMRNVDHINVMTSGRQKRIASIVGITLIYAGVSVSASAGFGLLAFGDIAQLLLLFVAFVLMSANAVSARGQTRLFWGLMALGCLLWSADLSLWTFYEVILRRTIPEPFIGDAILFVHVVPFMAAVALRPHQSEERKLYFSTLNFLMLLVWWVFLYAFIVFPDEYVVLNVAVYSPHYDLLYLVENLAFLAVLGVLAWKTRGAWKEIYANLFVASGLYSISSLALNMAIARGQYHTGSLYDIPFIASVCWMIWATLLARDLKPPSQPAPSRVSRWQMLAPRLAMLAMLSLPVMGYWAWFRDTGPQHLRQFRLLVTLAAMVVLGLFVFLRQFLMDRDLVRLLEESRSSLENMKRLQTELVQREKLASLAQLVSGAAHEINNPLAAILGYSELLAAQPGLESSQASMARKIGQQARRTRELVSSLLSFAQQSPGEKTLLDMGSVMQRALQMKMLRTENKNIHLESRVAPDLPQIWGNVNQLFQCCVEIIGNATDALEEVGGGTFSVSVLQEGDELVMEFSDSGPGIRDPQRIFDPFYTTKAVGKGMGLGLSVTYGVVQDHQGQITCENRPEGGAVFVLRFPVAKQPAPKIAEAARA
jgi:signal transduction histidine kinase